jgi:hypothetical protein
MDEAKVKRAAEVAREEAQKAPEHTYIAVFTSVFEAMLRDRSQLPYYTATGAGEAGDQAS